MENHQENNESLVNFVQSMVVVKPTFHITGKDMEEITKKVYGKEIKVFVELQGAVYSYTVKNDNKNFKDSVEYGLFYGQVYHMFYGDILNDLCNKGLLESGEYYLDCRKL